LGGKYLLKIFLQSEGFLLFFFLPRSNNRDMAVRGKTMVYWFFFWDEEPPLGTVIPPGITSSWFRNLPSIISSWTNLSEFGNSTGNY
jgi:hypothetical protein